VSTGVIILLIALIPVAILLPGISMKVSIAICGERAPGFFTGLLFSYGAGLVSFLIGSILSLTIGALISFMGPWATVIFGWAIGLAATGFFYSVMLRTRLLTGVTIAFVQCLMHAAFIAGVYFLLKVLGLF
jgi:hypothetical protein